MKLNAGRRWAVLLGLLAAAAGLYLSDGGLPAGPVPARAESAAPGKVSGADRKPEPTIAEIRPRPVAARAGDAFALRNWAPPPPPRPVVPSAPPLPFAFAGKKLEEGAWLVFLTWQDRMYIVKENEAIDGLYRVDAIRPPEMSLVYLPLQQVQTLAIGEAP